MSSSDLTLQDRARRAYQRLLILKRVFQGTGLLDEPEVDESEAGLREGVRDMLAELAEDARIMSAVPVPFSEWRSGDGQNDERWRTISQLERREVRQLVRAYEELIESCDVRPMRQAGTDQAALDLRWHRDAVARFKAEAGFLLPDIEERPGAGERPGEAVLLRPGAATYRDRGTRDGGRTGS